MQQALCVCVSKTDPVAAIPSPYPATTPPPHPTHTATLCEVWLCCKCSSGQSARPSNCCHVAGPMCSPLFWELCFTGQEGAWSYWHFKEINTIDSSLGGITVAFALYQILYCPKGCLPARWPHLKLHSTPYERWADQNNNQSEKALKGYWQTKIFECQPLSALQSFIKMNSVAIEILGWGGFSGYSWKGLPNELLNRQCGLRRKVKMVTRLLVVA